MAIQEYAEDVVDDLDVEGEIEVIKFKMVGKTILLMKSNAGVNPLNELVKQKSALTSIRSNKRTDEDTWEIYRLDFVLAMYHDGDIGPYVPGVNIERAVVEAAKQERMGRQCEIGVKIIEDRLPLQYKGPRDIEKLWNSQKFADIRPGKLSGRSSIMICRPCFNEWSLEVSLSFNGGIVDRRAVERWVRKVGDIGICDYRRRYGKSHVEII